MRVGEGIQEVGAQHSEERRLERTLGSEGEKPSMDMALI